MRADVLCGWCENGVSAAEMRLGLATQAERERKRRAELLTNLCDSFSDHLPYTAKLATFLTLHVWSESEGL